MGFFAGKTIAAIRAPDTYVYVAPFNRKYNINRMKLLPVVLHFNLLAPFYLFPSFPFFCLIENQLWKL
jgi:hypothetical protein